MSIEQLAETAQAMVAAGKGIIAIDESTATITKRFDGVGIENTEENRRAYREMLLTTPNLGELHLRRDPVRRNPPPVHQGRRAVHQGHDATTASSRASRSTRARSRWPASRAKWSPKASTACATRLEEYYKLGARFAKWRAVINIGDDIPSGTCIEANCHALARYAALCQEQGLVPMVEPEVLMDGDHDIETCYEVTEVVLRSLFDALYEQNVMLEGTILKASMVVSGKDCAEQASVEEVAEIDPAVPEDRPCRRSCRASCSCPAARPTRTPPRTSTR